MRKFFHLLASLTFLGWTGAANAALMQEIFFYFKNDGTTFYDYSYSSPPPSLLPSITVTLPTPSGLCISPCWNIGVKPSNFDPGVHKAGWVTDSFTAGGEWSSPGDNGPVAFDPLVITAEILEEGSDTPTPFQAVITKQEETSNSQEAPGGEGGTGTGGVNLVQYCEPQTEGGLCIEGTEIIPGSTITEGAAINRTVPLPSTLLLFGIGLLSLARLRQAKP
jgi:PEP-CTERM motif